MLSSLSWCLPFPRTSRWFLTGREVAHCELCVWWPRREGRASDLDFEGVLGFVARWLQWPCPTRIFILWRTDFLQLMEDLRSGHVKINSQLEVIISVDVFDFEETFGRWRSYRREACCKALATAWITALGILDVLKCGSTSSFKVAKECAAKYKSAVLNIDGADLPISDRSKFSSARCSSSSNNWAQ